MPGKANSVVVDAPVVGDQYDLNAFDAWVAGLDQKIPYDLARLIQGEQVSCLGHVASIATNMVKNIRYPNCGMTKVILLYTYSRKLRSDRRHSELTLPYFQTRLL